MATKRKQAENANVASSQKGKTICGDFQKRVESVVSNASGKKFHCVYVVRTSVVIIKELKMWKIAARRKLVLKIVFVLTKSQFF